MMRFGFTRIGSRRVRRYWFDRSAAAAAEFALVLSLLTIPLLNAFDLGTYVYSRMELDNAAQIAAQAAWATCNTAAVLPAKANCPVLNSAVATAAHSTTLGSGVSVSSITEGNYCVNTAGALVSVVSSTSCSAVNSTSGDTPGDYLQITTSYSYAPLFSGVSVTALLTTPITRTAWTRLN